MAKKIIGKPLVVGGRQLPLSNGVAANGFVFLAGQLGFDSNMKLAGDDVAAQTRAALENVSRLLAEAGCGLEDVVKVTAWLTDASLAADFNAVYAEYFAEHPPARSTVISGLLLPDALVEIEVVAAQP